MLIPNNNVDANSSIPNFYYKILQIARPMLYLNKFNEVII